MASVVAAVAIACGSSESSSFVDGTGDGDAGTTGTDTPGPFVGTDSGSTPAGCKKVTCAEAGATCGPIGDGCGGVVECGTCDADGGTGETCGGGGKPSVCGKPACTPKTCADIGANCGAAVDGCGGILPNCGTCTVAGQFCGGGGANKCGTGAGEADGGAADGGNVCVPKSCLDLGVNCGPAADGCGGIIPSCGACNAAAGESCGGGGTPSVCGKACVPKQQCAPGQNCGPVADGCGGIISCGGACPAGQTCGGGGVSNVCGGNGVACTGLCLQQTQCPNAGTTSISGTVTTPNGTLPIYGALVYVPNAAVQPFAAGVSCEQCGAAASGSPLVSTTTGPDGKFLLPNVPVSSADPGKVQNIPVVIQLGRWRKQFTVQTTACQNTAVAAGSTALPKNKNEGDIPLTAISTGRVDGLECVFRKIGIDDAEFTNPSGNGRIRFYQDNGAVITPTSGACSNGGASCTNFGNSCGTVCANTGASCNNAGQACGGRCANSPDRGCNNIGGNCSGNRGACIDAGTCTNRGTCNQTGGTPPASTLYNSPAELAKYDMTLFECVGGRQDKSATQQKNVRDYANLGGRVYATHFSYVWLYNADAAPWNATATWGADQASWASVTANLDTTFSKGQAFAQWLNIVGGLLAPLPNTPPPWVNPAPQITIDEARHDVDMPVAAGAQRWLYTDAVGAPAASLQHYTFNTDWTKPAAQQCGRVLFSDFHVTTGASTRDVVFPAECDNDPLTAQEKVLAFMLFDLASCVSAGPAPQACTPKTCVQQGVECGQAGDGCGNVIQCPDCPAGQTCGGGGVASKCGAPACVKKVCQPNQCGTIADGCGGTVNCGVCGAGTCGGGGANVCGGGACVPAQCPAPAPGSACGPVADGCGLVINCACPANTPCVNGKCGAPACVARTCEQAGANCGSIADGCGKLIDCGVCLAPQSCGGGGLANVCGGGVN